MATTASTLSLLATSLSLLECVVQAIESGDWQVDGRNDPEVYITYLSNNLLPAYRELVDAV